MPEKQENITGTEEKLTDEKFNKICKEAFIALAENDSEKMTSFCKDALLKLASISGEKFNVPVIWTLVSICQKTKDPEVGLDAMSRFVTELFSGPPQEKIFSDEDRPSGEPKDDDVEELKKVSESSLASEASDIARRFLISLYQRNQIPFTDEGITDTIRKICRKEKYDPESGNEIAQKILEWMKDPKNSSA